MRNKENWNLVEFKCKNCGCIIKAFPSRDRKYCKDCFDRKVENECEYCGKSFKSSKSRKQKFCCYEHAMAFRKGKKRPTEIGKKIRATKLKRVLTIPSSGNKRAIYLYPNVENCEECGETNKKKIHRHHIDKNPLNNNRDNIKFLCCLCHNRLHKSWLKRKI